MITYPPKPWEDGQQFKYTNEDGQEFVGTYNASKNAWSFTRLQEGVPGGGIGYITTEDVNTTPGAPSAPSGWTGLNVVEDINNLTDQKLVNWFLAEKILTNTDAIYHVLYLGPTSPVGIHQYLFWFNTSELALYVWNDAWFPVSGLGEGGVSTETFTYTIGQIQRIIDEVYLKNIAQDNRLDVLEENIVELEEEIDAIAPSVERGEWNYNPLVASPTNYTLLKGDGSPTDIFSQARLIFVSTTDADGNPHGFNNHEPGELLQIFNKDDDEYGLYEITDIDDNSSNSQNPYFSFTVDFVRAFSNVGKAVDRGRFKFFNAPEGGTADGFVLKTGDTMSGSLKIGDVDLMPDGVNTDSPKLYFANKNTSNTEKAPYLYSKANSTTIYSSSTLRAGGTLSAHGNLQYDGNTRVGMSQTGGYLGVGTSESSRPLEWNSDGIFKLWGYNGAGTSGQVLKLDNSLRPYWGDASGASNYVKTNTTGFNNSLTITKSGSTYYITGG